VKDTAAPNAEENNNEMVVTPWEVKGKVDYQRLIKEFGSIDPSQKVYFSFGAPIWVKGRGNEEHKTTIDFICEKLS